MAHFLCPPDTVSEGGWGGAEQGLHPGWGPWLSGGGPQRPGIPQPLERRALGVEHCPSSARALLGSEEPDSFLALAGVEILGLGAASGCRIPLDPGYLEKRWAVRAPGTFRRPAEIRRWRGPQGLKAAPRLRE
ncbi:Hypothetical predicted protein [Marmota monax]|uniref:Uncharacterized protein n=1 Tax=Marmota monax TaxID=9995 RepID=A0A5E4AY31_MARMO|nr:Hypothetical predicted protein [Marmota monax]